MIIPLLLILQIVEKDGNPRDGALIALMLFCGLRVAETTQVQTEDIKISARKGQVSVRAGKGMEHRGIYPSVPADAL